MKPRLRHILLVVLGVLVVALMLAFAAKGSVCTSPITMISDMVLLSQTNISVKSTQSTDFVMLNSGEKLALYFQSSLLNGLFLDLRKIPPLWAYLILTN